MRLWIVSYRYIDQAGERHDNVGLWPLHPASVMLASFRNECVRIDRIYSVTEVPDEHIDPDAIIDGLVAPSPAPGVAHR